MGKLRIHPFIREIATIFEEHGHRVYLVGGAVRNLLRGIPVVDWDLATDAQPLEVMKLFRRVIPTGIKHGTVTIRYKGLNVETTSFRTEGAYLDGRRPEHIEFAATIEEDLSRRDFTMNSIALRLPSGELVDPYGGQQDIKDSLIRCVGDPYERFSEDGLRPLRAIRFSAQLQFHIHDATLNAIRPSLGVTAKVSSERVRDELNKILHSDRPSQAFILMERTGLLELLFPELARCRGVEQKGFHKFDVLDHLLLACDGAPQDHLILRLAALLHDIGKPLVQKKDDTGIWTFYNHEKESENLTRSFLRRLRYPTKVIDAVAHLVAVHMFHYEDSWSDAAVRRFIVRVGEENLEDLYALRRADAWGTTGIAPPPTLNMELRDRVEKVLAKGRTLSIGDLAVNGEDLASIGVPRGPQMGVILKELLESVLNDQELNNRERLLEIAKKLNDRYQG